MSLAVEKLLTLAMLILLLAAPASAQMQAGETSLNLNGTISAGYNDDSTNTLGSDHGIAGAGVADLSGFYYNPNFLSFNVEPFYNQSRLNSSYQSMTDASGVNASVHLFGGSAFPGSISYTSVYNGSGNYGIPGLANYTTHGNTDTLAVGWGVRVANLPTLSLTFSDTNNSYSVFGANAEGTLHDDTFSATSHYQIAGFKLNGGYQYVGIKTVTPQFLTDEPAQQTDSGSNSFFLGVERNLPWRGSISASASRLDLTTEYGDDGSNDKYNANIDTLNGSLAFSPVNHLNLGENTYYTDNLEGTIYNSLVTAGVVLPAGEIGQSSHSLNLTGYAEYQMLEGHLAFRGSAQRQEQSYLGAAFADDSLNGTATYWNQLFGGTFNAVLGLTRTSIDTTQQSLLGVTTSANYTHQLRRWSVTGGFGYSQNTQTVLIAYTTSGYTYSGSVGRRIGRKSFWGGYASGEHTTLTGISGSTSSSHSFSTSLVVPGVSFSGSYSASSGNALLTATGLVSTPVPLPAVNPAAVVLYNGTSYSAAIGTAPVRGLTLSAIYAKASSGTQASSTNSNNQFENANILLSYHVRKLTFQAGYLRLVQGFTASGVLPMRENSCFVGVSRWFNFF